jgi:predicted RNA-binding Zn ribbon-like protein
MTGTQAERPPYNLCADHAALDFVNSLDNRFHAEGARELLADYTDLLRFSVQTRLLAPRQQRRLADRVSPRAAAHALHCARELREALAGALYAGLEARPPAGRDLRILERHFHEAGRERRLSWARAGGDSGAGCAFAWDWSRAESEALLPVWLLCESAAELVTSAQLGRLRSCGSPTCRWLFLDLSRNHTRRWCEMRLCGNRMKAHRFQRRHAG